MWRVQFTTVPFKPFTKLSLLIYRKVWNYWNFVVSKMLQKSNISVRIFENHVHCKARKKRSVFFQLLPVRLKLETIALHSKKYMSTATK